MALWGALLETFFIFGLGLCLFRPRHDASWEPWGTIWNHGKTPAVSAQGSGFEWRANASRASTQFAVFCSTYMLHPQRLCIRLGTSYIRCRFKSLFKPTRSCWIGNPGPNCSQLALSSVSFSLSSTSWAIHNPNGYGSRLDDQNLWSHGVESVDAYPHWVCLGAFLLKISIHELLLTSQQSGIVLSTNKF